MSLPLERSKLSHRNISLQLIKMSIMKNGGNTKWQRSYREIILIIHQLWKCKLIYVYVYCKIIWKFYIKTKHSGPQQLQCFTFNPEMTGYIYTKKNLLYECFCKLSLQYPKLETVQVSFSRRMVKQTVMQPCLGIHRIYTTNMKKK